MTREEIQLKARHHKIRQDKTRSHKTRLTKHCEVGSCKEEGRRERDKKERQDHVNYMKIQPILKCNCQPIKRNRQLHQSSSIIYNCTNHHHKTKIILMSSVLFSRLASVILSQSWATIEIWLHYLM